SLSHSARRASRRKPDVFGAGIPPRAHASTLTRVNTPPAIDYTRSASYQTTMNTSSSLRLSRFAQGLTSETAFDVLAVARRLRAQGKDVIELQIGDSPFNSSKSALAAGMKAIQENQTHYCASIGIPSFR